MPAPLSNAPDWTSLGILLAIVGSFLLGNAILDPSSRWGTLAVLGAILVGIPVFYLTVGRQPRAT